MEKSSTKVCGGYINASHFFKSKIGVTLLKGITGNANVKIVKGIDNGEHINKKRPLNNGKVVNVYHINNS